MAQRARLALRRHPELGEISAYCFYATRLRFGQLAFDLGANLGEHAEQMLNRGARVIAVEPQARLASQLAERLPAATVVRKAVSDRAGEAALHQFDENERWASLDASWGDYHGGISPASSERVPVTTLDELIAEFGEPAFVKIDTEGFEHRVLAGLSRPVAQLLFEIHADLPAEAAEAFERLDALARYEYRVSRFHSWRFSAVQTPEAIVGDLPSWGNVYARRVRSAP